MQRRRINALRGMKDLLPGEVELWQSLEGKTRDLFRLYDYREIRTPIMEETALFTKSIGEATDIVQKEMFSFRDRGDRNVSLRPEGTASVIRAYLEHNLDKNAGFCKLYYIGPMFRSERPQAGRLRQFHQAGVEVIGSSSPYVDAEVIILMMKLLRELGLSGCRLKINSLGCSADKTKFSQILKRELSGHKNGLCRECLQRFERNILRIFDCKNDSCKQLLRTAPDILGHLCEGCLVHFNQVKEILNAQGENFGVEPHLVRGLDYYTKTAFEAVHRGLGAQDAVGAGGKYDNLIKDLGGPDLPACGFAVGLDRLVLALDKTPSPDMETRRMTFIVTLGEGARKVGFDILQKLRERTIPSAMDYESRSLKSQMRWADKIGCRYVVIIGDDEIKKNAVILRDMTRNAQQEIGMDGIVDKIHAGGAC